MSLTRNYRPKLKHHYRRRAVVIVKVAILSTVLLGFAALGIDVGIYVNAGHELERAVEAAALAGAATMARSDPNDLTFTPARNSAVECALQNLVTGDRLHISTEDVEFGWAQADADGVYGFTPDPANVNAVRVTGRRTDENLVDGPISLIFAAVLGMDEANVTRSSTALMQPRDIVMVVDISDSSNNDSELRNLRRVEINLGKVWAALPGGLNEPTLPLELFTNKWDQAWSGHAKEYLASGFGWGFFQRNPGGQKWGNGFGYVIDHPEEGEEGLYLGSQTYNPDEDEGLLDLPSGVSPDGSAERKDWVPAGVDTPIEEIKDYLHSLGYKGEYNGEVSNSGINWLEAFGIDFDFDPHVPTWNQTTVHDDLQIDVVDSEIDAILSDYAEVSGSDFQREVWVARVAVATGFAKWNSGLKVPGQEMMWEQEEWTEPASYSPFNPLAYGNWIVEPEELVWETTTLGGRSRGEMKKLWKAYLDYIAEPETPMLLEDLAMGQGGDSRFQFKVGLKTFTDFLLARKPSHDGLGGDLSRGTPEFVDTPAQPLQAEQDAVKFLVDSLDPVLGDRLGLIVFATNVHQLVDLTDLSPDGPHAVPDALEGKQAVHYWKDSWTNIAGGIRQAREMLLSSGRPSATKVIVLVSDTIATAYDAEDGTVAVGDEAEAARKAVEQAILAGAEGIAIYAVGLGAEADTTVMADIARESHGRHFHVERFPDPASPIDIETYVEKLKRKFEEIAVIRRVRVVQ
ncbi:MAG: VWA domain-containing protein [Phycisphaerae bacterium]